MRDITIYYEDTKACEESGNRRWGSDFDVEAPYPIQHLYETEHDDGENWRKEYEILTKESVWKETFRWGGALERQSEEYFMHKDCLTTGLLPDEIKFLNAYRNRFLLIRDKGTLYIYDSGTRNTYPMEKQSTSFKDFKEQLKNLNLI